VTARIIAFPSRRRQRPPLGLPRPASGEWAARENLAHLARYHEVFINRIRGILTEDAPHLGRYRAEEDAAHHLYVVMNRVRGA